MDMDLKALWNYMQYDLEADKFSNEMKQSPKRKLLLKNTEILKEQQAKFAKSETDLSAFSERITSLTEEAVRLNKLVQEIIDNLGGADAADGEDTAARLKTADKHLAALEACEKELERVRKEAENTDRNQTEIKRRAAKAKQEYDTVKKEYDVEFAADKLKLKQLRDDADREAAKLDPDDYNSYKQIKQHATPPICKVVNNQCTGCFMTLSVGTLRDLKSSGTALTCDNCGRLLYTEEN